MEGNVRGDAIEKRGMKDLVERDKVHGLITPLLQLESGQADIRASGHTDSEGVRMGLSWVWQRSSSALWLRPTPVTSPPLIQGGGKGWAFRCLPLPWQVSSCSSYPLRLTQGWTALLPS